MAGEGYPDFEALLVAWLKTRTAITQAVKQIIVGDIPDDVPPNLPQVVPVIMVARYGGLDGVLGFDNPRVDVDVFASSRSAAGTIARKVQREILVGLPAQILSGAVITRVGTDGPPVSAAWDASTVRRATAAYSFGVHSPI